MKTACALALVMAAVALAGSGCGGKADLRAQTAELEKTFPGLAAAVAAQGQAPVQPALDDPKACVIAAVCAARQNDVATGVILLRQAVRAPGLSAEQIMAVGELRKAWLSDLSNRAAKGDESAKAGLEAISKGM